MYVREKRDSVVEISCGEVLVLCKQDIKTKCWYGRGGCVHARMAMNNALAVGVFIYNTLKMCACESRGTLRVI